MLIRLNYPLEHTLHKEPLVLALGNFDGVHCGHAAVIKAAVTLARQKGAIPAVLTFDPLPKVVLAQHNYGSLQHAKSTLLTPLVFKIDQMIKLGIHKVYVLNFDQALAKLSALAFLEKILFRFHLRGIVVGFNFCFGYKRMGKSVHLPYIFKHLLDSGANKNPHKIPVKIIDPVVQDHTVISSTHIREYILKGEITKANHCLGRRYFIQGVVVKGFGLGRSMGFPTANLKLSDAFIMPKYGVYASITRIKGQVWPSVINFGVRPTLHHEKQEVIEIHLLKFDGNLYGETLIVEFITFIREERKFVSVEDLINQIHVDVALSRTHLEPLCGLHLS